MMIFMNAATKLGKCSKEYAEGFIKMFSCICPHAGEEMWSVLGHDDTIAYESWPAYDEEACKEDTVEIGVQVNGKVKGTISIAVDEAKDSVLEKAKKAVEGKITGNIIKEIYVPGKIVSLSLCLKMFFIINVFSHYQNPDNVIMIIIYRCFVNCIPACFAFWLNANTRGSSSSLLFPLDSVLNSFNSSCFLKSVSDITIFLPLSICLHI